MQNRFWRWFIHRIRRCRRRNGKNRIKTKKKSYKIGIKFRAFNGYDFKYNISFPFRIPPYPNKGALRGLRGAGGGLKPLKTIWYNNSRIFNSGDFKNEVSFLFRIKWDPQRACPGVNSGGGAETYIPSQQIMWYINSRFSMVLISKMR